MAPSKPAKASLARGGTDPSNSTVGLESDGEKNKVGRVADLDAAVSQSPSLSRVKDREQPPSDARKQTFGHQDQASSSSSGPVRGLFHGSSNEDADLWLVKFESDHAVLTAHNQNPVGYAILAQKFWESMQDEARDWFLTDKLYLVLNRGAVSKEEYHVFRQRFRLRFFKKYDGSIKPGVWLASFNEVARLAKIDMTNRVWLLDLRHCACSADSALQTRLNGNTFENGRETG